MKTVLESILLVALLNTALHAADARVLPNQKDEQIVRLMDRLKAAAVKSGYDETEDAVDLFQNVVYDIDDGYSSQIVNSVRWVLTDDAEALDDFQDLVFWTGGQGSAYYEFAFVWKLTPDGDITRWDGLETAQDIGDDRRRIALSVDDVEPGDVVGLSYSRRQEITPAAGQWPVTQGYPVILFQCDVETRPALIYEFHVRNLEPGDYKTKIIEWRDRAPIHMRITALRVRPPARGAFQAPVAAMLPWVDIQLTSVSGRNARERMLTWNQWAMSRSDFWRLMRPDSELVQRTATSIVSGATSDRDGADRLFRWVRDEIHVPVAAADLPDRRSFDEIITSKTASLYDQHLLLATLLRVSGTHASMGLVRHWVMGQLTDSKPRPFELPAYAVLCSIGEQPVVYQMEWPGHAPGTIGEELAGSVVVRFELLTREDMEAFQLDVQKAGTDRNIDRVLRTRDWTKVIKLPQTTFEVGHVTSDFVWNDDASRAAMTLDATGPSDEQDALWRSRTNDRLVESLEETLGFVDFEIDLNSMEAVRRVDVDLTRRVESDVVHVGDDASITVARLLGLSPVALWEDQPHGSFFVGQPVVFTATARMPIDAARAGDVRIGSNERANDRFSWSTDVRVVNDGTQSWLTVTREVRTKTGRTYLAAIDRIRADVEAVRGFERQEIFRVGHGAGR